MITETVRDYMMTCPQLSGKKININCLGTRPKSFTIDNVQADPVIKQYYDGETLRQAVFVLAIRDCYDENIGESIYVVNLLEEIEAWIYRQNNAKNLPVFDRKDIICRGIEVTKSGHLYDTSMASGRWQMEFRVIYRQKA